MKTELIFDETRVIGALIEKEKTTPDQYPLSLNGLTLACNQKSNREPVVDFSETQVQNILDSLRKKGMVMEDSGFGSRVTKYKHRFANTEFGELKLSEQELGIITVLFLRGPQTPGELRSRTNRLCQFNDVNDVEKVLNGLISREDGPFVAKLPREPGKRENRYAHLFCGEPDMSIAAVETGQTVETGGELASRVADLEQRVAKLESILASLVDE